MLCCTACMHEVMAVQRPHGQKTHQLLQILELRVGLRRALLILLVLVFLLRHVCGRPSA